MLCLYGVRPQVASLDPEGRLAHWNVPVYTGSRGERVPRRLYHHLMVWLLLSCYILWLVLYLNYASIDVDVVVAQPTCDNLYLTSCVSYMLPYVVGLYSYTSHCFRNCRVSRWYWKLTRSTAPRSLASGVPTSPRSTVTLMSRCNFQTNQISIISGWIFL